MIKVERIPVLGRFFRSKPRKNFILALWEESNRNLERYYVVEQRQFITEPFDLEAWEEARMFSGIRLTAELNSYAEALRDFNNALRDVKAFEDVYSSSVERKTRENAELLHSKKELLAEKYQRLRPLIFTAHRVIREMLAKQSN